MVEEALMKMHRSRTARAETWTAIRNLLTPLLVSFPAASDQYRRSLTHRVAAFVLWAVIEMHIPLLMSDLFTDAHVRRFVTTNYTNPNTRAGYETVLQRFALHTTGEVLESRRANTSPAVTVYSRRELADIRSWAASRPEQNRLDAMTAVALAGGAGLRSVEISRVRTSDISISTDTVFVDVTGKMPRRIAMREEWTPGFLRAFQRRTNEPYVVKPHIVTAQSRRQLTAEVLRNKNVDRAKLRDTWVVDMLDRLPIRVICHIAGYSSLTALLARYEAFSKLDDLRIVEAFQDIMKAASK
ncbi:hypothetical protein ASF54_08435 [Frondihabitans sp. Leaf304]|nr:hypothetical protein ASF54_08435 [Frondihabitans sp. Leaf304]